ncbi:uncharacterized protein EV420DRAFT_1507455 [Desarmillaria tabescens]|uniref:Uncharacterized protein n=1 Tax=Armillaria tabescens TaxID=1929756 RepID=A0AA39TQN5_ARMTA|nr:uncharacterized protein EV420DRAFT_1507455 [Desarmillaria tabescens]KAK0467142.1 hypothetical protein EV420DRAFT_1507455 [Desarmillaria tabescens]
MARKTTRRSFQPTNAQKLWVSCPRDKRWNLIDDIIGRSIKESRDAGERKGHRSETYMRAAVIKGTETGLMKMHGNMVRLRKAGLNLIQDVIQECQDDSLSPVAQRRAHMHCFKTKLKRVKRPLYAELYSDLQKFKARYERERSLSTEPDDRMVLDSKEPGVESGMNVEPIASSSRLPPSTPTKMIIPAHSYPTPESIPRVGHLASRLFALLPSSFLHRSSMDIDIPESPIHAPRQYCNVAIATSPIVLEEDIDMVPPHLNVASSSLSFISHQSASSSNGDINMEDGAGTSPRCAGCEQVQKQLDAAQLEIEYLKEKVEEITEEMNKIDDERKELITQLEESEEKVSLSCHFSDDLLGVVYRYGPATPR